VNGPGTKATILGVCGLAHATIDAVCAGILLTLWQCEALTWPGPGVAFGLYNLLAFGTQPLLGWAVDWSRQPRAVALLGGGLVAGAALTFNFWPLPAVVTAGIGNALYHLGAGSICLRLTPGRATAAGIFVAPGDLGLFLGTFLGQAGRFVAWPFVLVLVGLGVALARLPLPGAAAVRPGSVRDWKWIALVMGLLLACIGIRSLVGFSVVVPWKSVAALGFTLALAIALGKALGGVLADRWGWGRVTVGGLALSAPLLAFGAGSPLGAIAGFFLFNLTMAVTLAAVVNLLPGRPALAFGSTCLALIIGAWPVSQFGGTDAFGQRWIVFGLILVSIAVLYIALRTAFKRLPGYFTDVYERVSAK
jgi:FSR family fosmidomycin resistance protein-like MFS transporter